ncbi:DUF3515 family protein [Plantactinospora sp. CA-290183]|uniref:DUF3515 family protein n=1 Tax=Plantactinospora sp. CA-290183 TaxID=3240006 RepID=UPI003D9327B9
MARTSESDRTDPVEQPEPDRERAPEAVPGKSAAGRDGTTRQAALWATAVALPLTALVALLVFTQLRPTPPAEPAASATAPGPQSTAPVQMTAAELAERPAIVCRALLSRLPASVLGLNQRPVTAGPEQNAAYGDPALTVACGVPPPTVAPDEQLWMVNQVCWQATPGDAGLVLTTVDREVAVRLTVPPAHRQTVEWAAPVAGSVVASVPSAKEIPSACGG